MPTVRLSTMYDLSTNNKFGIIGIHTPSVAQLALRYDGLLRNYKFLKVKKCSVKIACASVLPADPLQIGVSAGRISPADMMNPILYRAVSNDSWNAIINRIYNSSFNGEAADISSPAFNGLTVANSEKVYYSMLSQREWRKVMPQQGLSVKGLRPLVHQVVSVFGQQWKASPNNANFGFGGVTTDVPDSTSGDFAGNNPGQPSSFGFDNTIFRGRAIPMPAIPTTSVVSGSSGVSVDNIPTIPKTMVMAIILPQYQLQAMYFRMIVSWDIAFFGLRPATDFDLSLAQQDGDYARIARWSIASSKELESDSDNEANSVGCIDTLNMSPELVMES